MIYKYFILPGVLFVVFLAFSIRSMRKKVVISITTTPYIDPTTPYVYDDSTTPPIIEPCVPQQYSPPEILSFTKVSDVSLGFELHTLTNIVKLGLPSEPNQSIVNNLIQYPTNLSKIWFSDPTFTNTDKPAIIVENENIPVINNQIIQSNVTSYALEYSFTKCVLISTMYIRNFEFADGYDFNYAPSAVSVYILKDGKVSPLKIWKYMEPISMGTNPLTFDLVDANDPLPVLVTPEDRIYVILYSYTNFGNHNKDRMYQIGLSNLYFY